MPSPGSEEPPEGPGRRITAPPALFHILLVAELSTESQQQAFSKGQMVPPGPILLTEEAGLSRSMVQGEPTSRAFVLLNALPPQEESLFF
ncbi:unnamed protein product [Rangifer tarandus platyrhynchus]|uniref:Uncharacterized protein n=1 Tax=Rangifer tarandus platyrhynchus TaxID=3082113 RepID=A0AC59Z1M1_RANTA